MLRRLIAAVPFLIACSHGPENDRIPPLQFASVRPPFDAGTYDAPPIPPRLEACGNGVDDDGNGIADDGCICTLGDRQPCYPGDESLAGVGICAFGWQHCVANDAGGGWGACEGAVGPMQEVRDGFDNNCDGRVDEGFDEPMPGEFCYGSSSATLGVGPCRAGQPAFVQLDPDGTGPLVRDPARCDGQVQPSVEICDGIDNDCDGAVDDIFERCDGIDNDCDGVIDNGCPPSATAVLTRFTPNSGSGAFHGDRYSMLQFEARIGRACGAGETAVELRDGTIACVTESPPACPPGSQLDYDSGWRCVPCAIVIQFGYLYRGERACTDLPSAVCPPDQVPTFDEATRRWLCRPPCDNGYYDRSSIDGFQICIPC